MPRPYPSWSGTVGWIVAFTGILAAHVAVTHIGWADEGFAGHQFRQSQTFISTYFIQRDQDYQLAYPTPILGKPWSIPMEFPLYQWTVAKLSDWFGWPLIQTGRAVSLACFYLTLPAWFLLLGMAGLQYKRRLAVLMIVLTCPIYIFYSRAFMIESMALLFASWLSWCVLGAIRDRRWPWLLGAWFAGSGAALVKVTTWAAVLIPCALYVVWLIACAIRQRLGWRTSIRPAVWALAAVVPSLLVAWWWVQTADTIKAQNPAADFLLSKNLTAFNFGSLEQRVSGEFWATLYQHWITMLLPVPALLFILIVGLGAPGHRRNLIVFLLAGFLGGQLLFSNLFARHSYYLFSNGFLLVGAFGLAGCQLLDRANWPAWIRLGSWSLLLAAGVVTYQQHSLATQRFVAQARTGLTEAIQSMTTAEDVLVVLGDDWSSVIPLTTQRRALMVPNGTESQDGWWHESLAHLKGEQLPLLLVKGEARALTQVISRRVHELAMHPQPLFSFNESLDVYVRKDRMHAVLSLLRGASYLGVEIPRNRASPAGTQQFERERDRAAFITMSPFPIAYTVPYEVPPWFEHEKIPAFMAHPPTRLEFAVPAGTQTLTLSFGMVAEAYEQHGSDGVELVVTDNSHPGAPVELWRHRLNPRDRAEDRVRQSITFPLNLPASSITVQSLPGPVGNGEFDWVYFSGITFR